MLGQSLLFLSISVIGAPVTGKLRQHFFLLLFWFTIKVSKYILKTFHMWVSKAKSNFLTIFSYLYDFFVLIYTHLKFSILT